MPSRFYSSVCLLTVCRCSCAEAQTNHHDRNFCTKEQSSQVIALRWQLVSMTKGSAHSGFSMGASMGCNVAAFIPENSSDISGYAVIGGAHVNFDSLVSLSHAAVLDVYPHYQCYQTCLLQNFPSRRRPGFPSRSQHLASLNAVGDCRSTTVQPRNHLQTSYVQSEGFDHSIANSLRSPCVTCTQHELNMNATQLTLSMESRMKSPIINVVKVSPSPTQIHAFCMVAEPVRFTG